ncbi:MAG: nicotinate phosphoribosyltransferase [Planctomycetes bacterium]|nr:nicotinate phosphoribosyltransferase [Planctomycetota bacterium]
MKRAQHLFPEPGRLGGLTDLYQLTMAAGYHAHGMNDPCVFELFVRRLPANRGYLLAAGLEQALAYLADLSFDEESLRGLRDLPAFRRLDPSFFEALARLRFTGDVRAVPEGTVVFPGEPLLSVRAPAIQAQVVETYLLATIGFQTLVATKASRVVGAARGRDVVDFGSRRAHGPQAGLLAARACLIAGSSGTSNVLAGLILGARVVGTAAHSWTMMFDSEEEAFRAYHSVFPDSTLLLVDTYDSLAGTRRAIRAAGKDLAGVRIDSGDLAQVSRDVRRILDEAGLPDAKIVASGDLNEEKVEALVSGGAPIDVFGVGTEMVTSRDDPTLSVVYKLVAVEKDGKLLPRVKSSPGKATYPLPKQVYRRTDSGGLFAGDTIAALEETRTEGEPLLALVVSGGERVADLPDLATMRQRAADQVARLPEGVRRLRRPQRYPVRYSRRLQRLAREEAARHVGNLSPE